ncbi:hypothetical protein [Citricoccus sp. K5]|uniref:hypothetical protein n=1 Tax=Citricoccus sp. K5 TaxID=2653135 RepID=UPI0012F4419E|nr:hypothetical protein [Citricoccus sp. K5]VXB78638.1 conserved membrane hypothetical protein [Citricoccus sp. K5]
MKTARHLALPAAVALHTMGSVLVSLATWAVIATSASPGALNGGLWVLSYTLAAAVGLLGILGLALALRDRRAGPGGQEAQTLASVALATALILLAVRTFIPLGVVDRAIGFEGFNAVLQTLSMAGLLLAATAVVAGAVAARRAPRGPGTVARVLSAIAPPAALVAWGGIPLLAPTPSGLTIASALGSVLALVGLGAAVVLLRRSPGTERAHHEGVGREAGGALGPDDGPVGKAADAAAAMERTGRRFLRHLATPLGLACLALILPLLDVVQSGQGAWLPLVFAVVLAIAAVAGAVLDYRALGGTEVPRAGRLVGELGVPASILVIPVALLLGGLAGGGWAMLGALVIGLMVAALVALIGLIGVLFSAASGRYASRAARSSVIATALVFVAAATFIPFQSTGAALVSVMATALLLLVALGSGLVAVLSSRPTLRLPERTEPLLTETTDADVNAVRNPYL